jgi:hypothetical protein
VSIFAFTSGPKPHGLHGEVVSDQGRQRDGWHRYGVRFPNLTTADMDLLSDVAFNLVVPDLMGTLNEPAWLGRSARLTLAGRPALARPPSGGARPDEGAVCGQLVRDDRA